MPDSEARVHWKIRRVCGCGSWLPLDQGDNSITYDEDNMIDTDLTESWRGRKV